MGKFAYTETKNFTRSTRDLLNKIIAITEEYKLAGYKMTLRQLYYQLVARKVTYGVFDPKHRKDGPTGQQVFENKTGNYGLLSRLLTQARMMGLVDWDFIEDRIRVPKIHSEFKDIDDLLQAALDSYRRQRWNYQKNYVEVWVEKDALSGVLYPITDEYHVRLLVNRGYSSASAMHDASLRFISAENNDKKCFLRYVGDHDPSGEDMVRDVKHRLMEFGATVDVDKIALTKTQIEQYNPPPNPAKLTDPRADDYIAEHGDLSWEVDALPPDVLSQILRDSLNELTNKKEYNKIKKLEEKEKEVLENFKDRFYEENKDLNVEPENKEDDFDE